MAAESRHFGRTPFLALRANALTTLRHSGRAFTAHVAEGAGISKGLCPLTRAGAPPLPSCGNVQWAPPLDPARGIMPLDPKLLYNIAPKGAGSALTLRRTFIIKSMGVWGYNTPTGSARV